MPKDYSAPGPLELVRRFVNSLDVEHPEADPFLSTSTAAAWLRSQQIEVGAITDAEATKLRDLREALRAELLEHAGEGSPGAWARLATLLTGAGLELVFDRVAPIRLEPSGRTGYEALVGAIAARVYDAVKSGEWRRLKACRKETCLFAFYDRSKNGSGTWCDMAVCGNRAKAQRRRVRERTGAGARKSGSD